MKEKKLSFYQLFGRIQTEIFEEPTLDGNLKGYNAEGKQGEEGSWTGAISLSPNDGKLSYGGDNPIGGYYASAP